MADDFDVEALLEAPYKKEVNGEAGKSSSDERDPPPPLTPEKNGEKVEETKSSSNGGTNDTSEKISSSGGGGGSKSKHRDKSRERRSSKSRHRSRSPRHRSKSRHRSRSKHRSKSPRHRSRSRGHRSSRSPPQPPPQPSSRRRSRSGGRRNRTGGGGSGGGSGASRRSRSPPPQPPPSSSSGRHRSKSRERDRERDRDRGERGSDRNDRNDRHHHSKRRSRSRSRGGGGGGGGGGDRRRRRRSLTPISLPRREPFPPYPRYRKSSPIGGPRPPPVVDDLTPEERDARTIFCMQLSQKIRAKDLEEFFSSVGKVRDVRLITCNKTRRFKGIAYIEFKDPESVALALGLNGQKLLDIPIVVQPTQAEKNRIGNSMPNLIPRSHPGPVRLYVGSLHYNITEDMLRGIFEPFGKIDSIMLMTDSETGRSKGYGFVTYHNSEDAKKALEQMNGFELAGRPMKVNNVTDRHEFNSGGTGIDETDERAGIDLGATGRLQLMYKLAEGTGMEIPPAAASALNLNQGGPGTMLTQAAAPPIATQCFLLANMFDPNSESSANWDVEIKDDVIEECNRHGGCVHVYVDKASPQGNVYVKCPTINTAVAAVNSLHGRWFGGRVITAAYVPVLNYHNLFPETIAITTLLAPSRKSTN